MSPGWVWVLWCSDDQSAAQARLQRCVYCCQHCIAAKCFWKLCYQLCSHWQLHRHSVMLLEVDSLSRLEHVLLAQPCSS